MLDGHRQRCARARRPKTLGRWLRLTLLLGGITQPVPLEDAYDLAAMLVSLGRAVPMRRWVDSERLQAEGAAIANFGIR